MAEETATTDATTGGEAPPPMDGIEAAVTEAFQSALEEGATPEEAFDSALTAA